MDRSVVERQLLELEELSNAEERLEWLIARTPIIAALPDDFRVDEFRIRECLTPLWFRLQVCQDTVSADCFAQSQVVSSIVSLICDYCSGSSIANVACSLDRIDSALGLTGFLTPGRRIAIQAVFNRIKSKIYSEVHASN